MTTAEDRVRAMILAGTWINAYSGRDRFGAIAVHVQRPQTVAFTVGQMLWTTITDDATT